ncbi:MAG TPA: nitroreductase family protein [Dissulfurispiraceae bacterium]|nr:nitroreductase family protein [Dissulfurispiraceae bacterium]
MVYLKIKIIRFLEASMTPHEQSIIDNETLKTIRNRRSIRSFTDQPVTDKQIQVLLSAANEAPSAHNQQSWRFIVLRNRKKQELADLVSARANDFPRPSSALLRMAARSIVSAPVVIAVANTGELMNHGTDLFKVEKEMAFDFFRTMEIQSSAAAVQNLLLAATSTGLATVWLGILYLMKDDVLRQLGEPEGEFMAVVPVGYAQRETRGPKKQPVDMRVKFLD